MNVLVILDYSLNRKISEDEVTFIKGVLANFKDTFAHYCLRLYGVSFLWNNLFGSVCVIVVFSCNV